MIRIKLLLATKQIWTTWKTIDLTRWTKLKLILIAPKEITTSRISFLKIIGITRIPSTILWGKLDRKMRRQLIKQYRSKPKEVWSKEKYSKAVTESTRVVNMTPWTLINSSPNNQASWSSSNLRRVKFSPHWIHNQNPRRNSRLLTVASLRRQISSCTKARPKAKHHWPTSSQEVLLDQAWSLILKNKAYPRLLAESRVLTL